MSPDKPAPLDDTQTRVAAIKKVLEDFDAMPDTRRGTRGYFRGSARPWAEDLRFAVKLLDKMDGQLAQSNELMELAALKMAEYRQKIKDVTGQLEAIKELVQERSPRGDIVHLIDSAMQEVAR